VVNKEAGRVYVDGFERRTCLIEVDATDAIHFIWSLRHMQIFTLMSIEFSGNISLTLTFTATSNEQTCLISPFPTQHRMQTAHRLY
jgi:hypothetical protein